MARVIHACVGIVEVCNWKNLCLCVFFPDVAVVAVISFSNIVLWLENRYFRHRNWRPLELDFPTSNPPFTSLSLNWPIRFYTILYWNFCWWLSFFECFNEQPNLSIWSINKSIHAYIFTTLRASTQTYTCAFQNIPRPMLDKIILTPYRNITHSAEAPQNTFSRSSNLLNVFVSMNNVNESSINKSHPQYVRRDAVLPVRIIMFSSRSL